MPVNIDIRIEDAGVFKSWTIGSGSDCDLVVDVPKVSGRHCRLTRTGGGYTLEDLGSTNGTYVNGVRVIGSASVSRSDAITLGLITPLPWPSETPTGVSGVVRIGREPDNDLVIDLPMVSGHHARVVWEGKPGEAVIEDLGSSNGTALGSPDRKVKTSAFTLGDTIYLGSHPVPAALLLARIDPSLVPALTFRGEDLVIGRDPACGRPIDLPTVSSRHARLRRSGDRITIEDLGSSNGTFVNGARVSGEVDVKAGDLIGLGSHAILLAVAPEGDAANAPFSLAESGGSREAPGGLRSVDPRGRFAGILASPGRVGLLLLAAPVVGVAIAVAAGMKAPATSPEGGATLAAIFSWLGLAAVGFGLADAVLGDVIDARRLRDGLRAGRGASLIPQLGVLVVLCLGQCAVCWGIVATVAGLRASAFASVSVLTLAALVGLAAGLLLVVLSPRPAVAWAALGPIVLVLWLFGGERRALTRMDSWARAVANALPSRWAFEGLLVLEADARPTGDPATDAPDLAEGYFPAETLRTGPRGAAMALGFLLAGLSASAAFTARASRRDS